MIESKKVLPNLIIAGVNKAGTTSLFAYLSKHPDFCSSAIKETCYFLPERYNEKIEPIENYHKQFEKYNGQKIIMEATPGYFYGGPKLVSRIQKEVDNIKIIVVLREPVSRLVSFYKFMKTRLQLDKNLTFEAYVSKCKKYTHNDFKNRNLNPYFGVKGGEYINFIDDWKHFFPHNFMLIDFDSLKKDPLHVLESISEWLGVDSAPFKSLGFEIENKTKSFGNKSFHSIALKINHSFERIFRKSPQIKKKLSQLYFKANGKSSEEVIDKKEIELLKEFYEPFNKKLKDFLIQNNFKSIPNWLNEK
jgi:hypothetical protein